MQFLDTMRRRVLFEFRRPVEAFPTYGTFMGVILSVHRYDVALQVAGVRTLVVTVSTLVGLSLLVCKAMLQQLLLLSKGLEAALTLVGHFFAMLGFDVRLEVGGICRLIVAVEAEVGLFTCVRAHVFL